jgi:heme O synthase-like polyprenyltransferase
MEKERDSPAPRTCTAYTPFFRDETLSAGLFALTKPRIIELLLVTTVPAMLLARRGVPAAGLLVVTLVGGALAAGSANTINCYLDRDIDALMRRTSRRPLARPAPLAVIRPGEALVFGVVLGAAATVLLGMVVNWLSAGLADAAILFYVFVYTIWLKPRSAWNAVIGGAAGAAAPLIIVIGGDHHDRLDLRDRLRGAGFKMAIRMFSVAMKGSSSRRCLAMTCG